MFIGYEGLCARVSTQLFECYPVSHNAHGNIYIGCLKELSFQMTSFCVANKFNTDESVNALVNLNFAPEQNHVHN